MTDDTFQRVAVPRGISPGVWAAGFYPYDQGDVNGLWAAYAACGQRPAKTDVARCYRAPGTVMQRWAVPEADPLITPEMRPKWPVLVPRLANAYTIQIHDHDFLGPVERERHVAKGSRSSGRDLSPAEVAKARDKGRAAVVKACTPGELADIQGLAKWEAWWSIAEGADHYGVDTYTPHIHVPIAKYLFKASLMKAVDIGEHAHSEIYRTDEVVERAALTHGRVPFEWEMYDLHLRLWHSRKPLPNQEPLDEWGRPLRLIIEEPDPYANHAHRHEVKDTEIPMAKRLSWHPYRREERWAGADTVFFALEGCLKEAALVSAGVATFSCPSVTLWEAPELEAFAVNHLAGRRVLVVCDSDWGDGDHWQVIQQTMKARDRLRSYGVDAHCAAPPAAEDGTKLGVDDYLGPKYKGTVGGLVVWDLERNVDTLEWLLANEAYGPVRLDGLARDSAALDDLAMHSDPKTGQTPISLNDAGVRAFPESPTPKAAGKRMQRAVAKLIGMGAVTVIEPLRERWKWTSLGRRAEWTGILEVHDDLRPRVVEKRNDEED